MATVLAKIWLVAKYVIAVALLLVAGLLGVGAYFSNAEEKAFKESAVIQSLDQAERERKDVLKVLLDGFKKVDKSEAKLVVRWLSKRATSGDGPYLYMIGLYHGKLDGTDRDKLKGLEYLAAAALVYRVDRIQCRDRSAPQAVSIFESAIGMGGVRDNLKTKPEIRKKVIASALAYEEKNGNRPRPDWICRHGILPGSDEFSTEIWQANRQKVRSEFETSF